MPIQSGKHGISEAAEVLTYHDASIPAQLPECFARIDGVGTLLGVNHSFCGTFGYEEGELTGARLDAVVSPEDSRKLDQVLGHLPDKGLAEAALRGLRKDGSTFHMQIILTTTGLETEGEDSYFCFVSDVSRIRLSRMLLILEQKILRQITGAVSAEAILQDLCRDMEGMVEGSHCLISRLSDDGAWLEPLVDTMEEAGQGDGKLRLPVGDRGAGCGAAVSQGRIVIIDDVSRSPYWADYLDYAAEHNIRATWSNPILSRDGEVLGAFGMALDRHDRPDEMEMYLLQIAGYLASIVMDDSRGREALQRYEEMVRSSRDMMVYIDRHYIYRAVSNSYAGFYGLDREDVIGRHVSDVVGGAAFDDYIKSNLDRSFKGEAVDWQGWVELAGRSGLHMTSHYDPIIDNSEVIGVVVVIRNTTEIHTTEVALRESEERFSLAMQGVNEGLWDWNVETNEVFCTPTWGKMLGYSDEEYQGSMEDFYLLLHPSEKELVRSTLQDFIKGDEDRFELEFRLKDRSGHYLDILSRGFGIRDPQSGLMRRIIGINADITERKQAELRIQESEKRFRSLFDDSPTMFFTLDLDGNITSINQYAANHLGYQVHEMIGKDMEYYVDIEDREFLERHFQKCREREGSIEHCEFKLRHKYEDRIWVKAAMRLISWENSREILVSCEDITETRILSEQLEYQAKHDALTSLINRAEFERRLRRILNSQQSNDEHAMCFLDLDQFKVINDTCGHLAGDELLRRVSHILETVVRKRDTLARLGGDEFAVLLEHCPLEQARRVAADMLEAVQGLQFSWEGKRFNVGVTIGMVPINENSGTVTDVLSAADAACYAAKDAGRNRIHVYRQDDMELAQRRTEMRWVSEINQALEEGRFRLARQPILSLDEDNSSGEHYELLIRMESKSGEIIFPGAFLAAAERYNLSTKLDRWVISTAFDWLLKNPAELQGLALCAINLSGHSLGDPGFLQFLMEKFQIDGIEAEKFCFEITETAAIANLGDAIQFIHSLREIGCSFSLDDFGSGLSSFNYLKNLPVDFLKIDGSFVREISHDPIDLAMVRSINDIGHVMNKKTIAEFVEDEEILQILRDLGVDYAQGFGLGRPKLLDFRD